MATIPAGLVVLNLEPAAAMVLVLERESWRNLEALVTLTSSLGVVATLATDGATLSFGARMLPVRLPSGEVDCVGREGVEASSLLWGVLGADGLLTDPG